MNIKLLVEQLKKDEGYSEWSYADTDQHSWGYGTKAPGPDQYIGKEQADVELWQRAALAIRDFYRLFQYANTEIDEVRQLALGNMCYNLGLTKIMKFRDMLQAIQAGNWLEVSAQGREPNMTKTML